MEVEEIFPDIIIPVEEIDFFNSNISLKLLVKGDYFLKCNTVCNEMAFIDYGLLRSVIQKGNQKYSIALHSQFQFISAFTSFFNQENSHCSIQALEPTHLTVISGQLFQQLCQRHDCWTQFWLRVLVNKTTDLIEQQKHLLGRLPL
jgi:signal-transduction protein with cAMP-binding, CBS, and nucleotidyltransferase domain